MGKRNNRSLNQIYSRPLPITLSSEVYGPLPSVFPHNPVSWLYFAYKYFYITLTKLPPRATTEAIAVEYADNVFTVHNEEHMIDLWRSGFFGKGTLSRSDPTWKERVSRRLHLNNEFNDSNEAESKGNNKLTNEDVTKIRREERKKFKIERSKLQELEIKQRSGTLNEDEEKQLEQIKTRLEELRIVSLENDQKIKKQQDDEGAQEGPKFSHSDLREEDQVIVDPNTEDLVKNLEVVQLQTIETFFLKFALNVVDVKNISNESLSTTCLFDICCNNVDPSSQTISPDSKFILDYVVYHRYRSLGWCARSGIKFGCDMLLYKRGPPFSHAEYGVLISTATSNERKNWSDIQALTRVIGGVKKCFVLVYVDVPSVDSFNRVMYEQQFASEREKFVELFKLYKVTEVLYRRWVPSKTRD